MGDALAEEVKRVLDEQKLSVDVVIPVPDTSRVAALNLAQKLDLPYREGFIKNRYVGRTFIMPGQQMRKKNVRRKLNAMALEFQDKNVLIVDGKIPSHFLSRLVLMIMQTLLFVVRHPRKSFKWPKTLAQRKSLSLVALPQFGEFSRTVADFI